MAKRKKGDVGSWIDRLYALRAERLALEKQVEAMKGSEQGLRVQILERLQELAITKASGEAATFSFRPKPMGQVIDWSAVEAWIWKNKAFDLFQRRLHQGAWLERVEDGQAIPGIERASVLDVSITKKGER